MSGGTDCLCGGEMLKCEGCGAEVCATQANWLCGEVRCGKCMRKDTESALDKSRPGIMQLEEARKEYAETYQGGLVKRVVRWFWHDDN